MKVKLAPGKIMAGPTGTAKGGDVIEVSKEEGQALVETGQAELIEADIETLQDEKVILETAEAQPEIETADSPKRGRKRKA